VEEICDVTITAEDADWLATHTRQLVEEGLAACGNIVPGVRSIYRWEGAVEDDPEALVILHTRRALVDRIVERTNRVHANDVVQILAVPVVRADPAYHRWVLDSTIDA
jgi:periplasmic divalent cation tolerance protein